MRVDPPSEPPSRVRLDRFTTAGLDRGRTQWVELCWYVLKCVVFLSPIPWPSTWKAALLRAFGAAVGKGVVIKPRVNIHFPWKLSIGDHTWIGEEVFILNLEQVSIGSNVCISQRAFLCTGNHDFRDPQFAYSSEPITVRDGAWVGAQVFVCPGTHVGTDAVILANSRAGGNIPPGMICEGIPARPVKPRWRDEGAGDRTT